jgi:type I restriction-modification system DNA methylase subunit
MMSDRLSQDPTEPPLTPDGELVNFLDDEPLRDSPEERIRQKYLRVLHFQYGYPRNVLVRQLPIYSGRRQARDAGGNPIFADIGVYETPQACSARDQGGLRIVVEVKAPDENAGYTQLVSYIFNTSANGGVWYNGDEARWYRRLQQPEQRLVQWPGIPPPGEAWDAVGRRAKDKLLPLRDVRGTLERCHNKLYRRGAEGDDLTMDMVRILLAKARDEEREGVQTLFYCTGEELGTEAGHKAVAARVESLFEEVRDANPTVFDPHETIRVGTRQIVDVVVELQDFRLIGDDDAQWDLMGAAYEQYTAEVLKREGGEFFTNRLVVRLLTRMVDPRSNDRVLDPAGGTGGFCTAALRHMRESIRSSSQPAAVKRKLMDAIKDRIFYIEVKNRLVKIAKAAMILSGNGHRGFTQGDSLAPFERLPQHFLEMCQPNRIDAVLTNPPFAGMVNGRIPVTEDIAEQFQLSRRWEWKRGRYVPTDEPNGKGVPPELLFIERSLQWLRPGGTLGIVVPKGLLENPEETLAARHFIFRHSFVRAVIACHKNTFKPYTGSRTALLVLTKKTDAEITKQDKNYPIFMAISRKIGQDSEGEPLYVKDEEGRPTNEVDHDLNEIFRSWQDHLSGHLNPSEYTFAVDRSQLDERSLIVSPQSFLPAINEAIATVVRLGDSEEFTVTPLKDVASRIHKGTRFKREDLESEKGSGPGVIRYYTPAALLQDRAEGVKFLDLNKAEVRRRKEIQKHQLGRLQLLVTRSGTIGRVILTTAQHEGHVGSDDLIHIDIEDEDVRLFVYQFLRSDLGQKQMLKNEYGTIQQHLEPRHVGEVLLPMPTNHDQIAKLAELVLGAISSKEAAAVRERQAEYLLANMIGSQQNGAS